MSFINPFRFGSVGGGGGGGSSLVLSDLNYTAAATTSTSFTPTDNSLLVVLIQSTEDGGAWSLTNTAGLTFTQRVLYQNGAFQHGSAIWTAPITTGTSMTVSLVNGSSEECKIQVVDIVGYNTTTPTGATHSDGVGNDTRSGSYSGALSASSSANSIIVGCAGGVGALTDVDTGTSWTQLNESVDTSGNFGHFQYFSGATSNYDLQNFTSNAGFPGWSTASLEIL